MTADELQRPRIDVVVQTSGQLRDIAASRLYLIQKAIGMAASDNSDEQNFVQEGVLAAKKRLLEKGFSPKDAEELSKTRVFGGINGSYGAGNFTGMVEKSDAWDQSSDLAQNFINNMGATYGDENAWGEHKNGVFEAALLNTEAVVQPRQSNTWGPLSLDHMYEFMGGMNLAIKEVTGNDAESYLSDYRNSSNPRMQGLKEGIWSEARTTLLNPRYIREYMNGGTSAAETFAETFRNTFGWNATKPSVIENRLWDELYDTYIKDKQQLGIHRFFEQQNPYALQEMTAVMLETVRKGLWKATDEQVGEMVKLHTQLVKEHDAGCSGFVCDNPKLRKMIAEKLPADEAKVYNDKIDQALAVAEKGDNKAKVLKKEEKQNKQQAEVKTTREKSNKWMMMLAGVMVFAGAIVYLRIRNNRKQDDK
jgi:cobaltochelatase CobN